MTNTALFATVLRSIYALEGANGAFIADLTRPIPHGARPRKGTLARIPAYLKPQPAYVPAPVEGYECSVFEL